MLTWISTPLKFLIEQCWRLTGGYVLAVILFTLLTKVILFPVSLWTQRNGIRMLEITPELDRMKADHFGDSEAIAEGTQALYKREHYHPLASMVPLIIQLVLLVGVIGAVRTLLDGSDSTLSVYPAQAGGIMMLMPLAAGASALILGLAQNHLNPLQREQTKAGQWSTNGLSIAISLALGAFVPVGVGVYWICSNLFTIVQQVILNAVMPAKKYVDYEALAAAKAELAKLNSLSAGISREDRKREKEDYKRFFHVVNKHLVFYSESSGFYKYFQDVIEYLLDHSNVTIHYVTSDPKDQIFDIAKTQPRIRPYYIGEKRLITLFMKMDADMVVMTVPDLDNMYLKRSYVRKDVEYVYMFHGVGSVNLLLRKLALAHYDTIFCVGEHQVEELREEEQAYGLPARNLVPCGYGLLDRVIAAYEAMPKEEHEKPQVLIAPSWQKDNILDLCIDPLLESLLCGKYRVILRPHPEYIKRYPQKMAELQKRYAGRVGDEFIIQTDFSSNETVFQSDLLITDWSTICFEFSWATKRPTLFVDTPMKVMNPDYQKLKPVPLDIAVRQDMGRSIRPEECGNVEIMVDEMLASSGQYREKIVRMMEKCLYNPGRSGAVGGQYILNRITAKKHVDAKGEGRI